jgi:beta-lactamase class A
VKEPLQHFVNAQPFLLPKPGGKKRRQAYQAYQKSRRRQQRLAILAIGLMAFISLVGFAVWGLLRSAKPLLDTLLPDPIPVETLEFQNMLAQDAGFSTAPSLLYNNSQDYAAFSTALNGSLKDKLMPVLPIQEDASLKVELEQLLANYPSTFTPYLYYYNPLDGTYVEINGYKPVSAASVIKLPILLNYLIGLDHNVMQMDSPVLYANFHRAGGAGDLQYQDPGIVFPANQVASQMIRISDNTCTNIMIHALGGTDAVNQKLANLGLTQTRIRNWLPDLEGTNTISPYEMVTILYNIDHGPLVSDMARYDGLGILESTHNRRLLVSPLPDTVRVAHKTGDIGTALGDSGIVYMPDGGKYIISMQVERPYNDYTARDMVQNVSRRIYDHVLAKRQATLLQAQADSKEHGSL